jgi:hypothetical protein
MKTRTHGTSLQPPRGKRFACLAGGFAAGTVALAVVAVLFGEASSNPWLPDTREAAALAARCDRAPTSVQRDACMQRLVADWQAGRRGEVRLASTR